MAHFFRAMAIRPCLGVDPAGSLGDKAETGRLSPPFIAGAGTALKDRGFATIRCVSAARAAREESMKRLAMVVLTLALAGLPALARPAAAFDEQAVMVCTFKRALAILTCKDPDKYSFVGVRDGVYVFNSFSAKGHVEFYVQLNADRAVFTSRAWEGRMPAGRIVKDYNGGCINVLVDPLPCSKFTSARCCGSQQ